jgi:hypothetical protein
MGYRSDVALGIIFADAGALKEFALKVVAFQPDNVREALTDYCESETTQGFIFAGFEGYKWYPSYGEVEGHMQLQSIAREHGACTVYLRVGEEPDDIEREFSEPNIDKDCFDVEEIEQRMQILYDSFDVSVRIDRPQGGKQLEFK